MPSSRGQLLVALLLLLAATGSHGFTVVNTVGKTFLGFTFDVDTTLYRNLTADALLITTYHKQKKFALANTVYASGFHARTRTGTLRNLKTIGNTVRPETELFFKKSATFYGTPKQLPVSYIEKHLGTSITAATTAEKLSVGLQWILLSFVGHELDVAYNVIGTPSGAATAIAEVNDGFGLWYGYPDAVSLYTHWAAVDKWGPACAGSSVARTVAIFKRLQTAAKANNAANLRAAYNDFFDKDVPSLYLRAILYASGRAARSAAWQSLSSGYLKIIQPLLNAKAKPFAATLQTLLSGRALANPGTVRSYLNFIATRQGIALRNVGFC